MEALATGRCGRRAGGVPLGAGGGGFLLVYTPGSRAHPARPGRRPELRFGTDAAGCVARAPPTEGCAEPLRERPGAGGRAAAAARTVTASGTRSATPRRRRAGRRSGRPPSGRACPSRTSPRHERGQHRGREQADHRAAPGARARARRRHRPGRLDQDRGHGECRDGDPDGVIAPQPRSGRPARRQHGHPAGATGVSARPAPPGRATPRDRSGRLQLRDQAERGRRPGRAASSPKSAGSPIAPRQDADRRPETHIGYCGSVAPRSRSAVEAPSPRAASAQEASTTA